MRSSALGNFPARLRTRGFCFIAAGAVSRRDVDTLATIELPFVSEVVILYKAT